MSRPAPKLQLSPKRKVKAEAVASKLRDALAALVAAAEGTSGPDARLAVHRAKALLERVEGRSPMKQNYDHPDGDAAGAGSV